MKIWMSILLLIIIRTSFGQISNDKNIIIQNRVKSSLEKHCFLNSTSNCTIIYEEYDKNGNSIEWNMGRLGSFYQNVYDKKNNKTMTLWVDKIDTTQIDTLQFIYDQNNQLIIEIFSEDSTQYNNHYNDEGQLVKMISESTNSEGNIVRETTTRMWTSFDKIQSEFTTTEILEVSTKTKYNKHRQSKIENNFDQYRNITKTTYYDEDTVTRTITYQYDARNREIEELDYDLARIERINKFGYGNRDKIEILKTTTTYLDNGQIDELYTYFSDPCMSLDNHFLYKHYYQKNGLIEHVDVYEKDKMVFNIYYEYEFFK